MRSKSKAAEHAIKIEQDPTWITMAACKRSFSACRCARCCAALSKICLRSVRSFDPDRSTFRLFDVNSLNDIVWVEDGHVATTFTKRFLQKSYHNFLASRSGSRHAFQEAESTILIMKAAFQKASSFPP